MTTDARVKADNADWLASTGGLCLADALAIHDAIHSSAASVTLSGFGQTMPRWGRASAGTTSSSG